MNNFNKNIVLVFFFMLFNCSIQAQVLLVFQNSSYEWIFQNLFLIIVLMVLIGVLLFIGGLSFDMIKYYQREALKEHGKYEEAPEKDFIGSWLQKLGGLKSLDQEKSLLIQHDYDGIQELDNSLPPWWLYLFYGCILFAGVYMYIYEWSDRGWSSLQEYEVAVDEAKVIKAAYLAKVANSVNENTVEMIEDPASLAQGASTYKALCVACHGAGGEGGIGPNMTDEYWLHGGSLQDVFKTIKYGVPDKGMISWKDQLKPTEIHKVASYIMTLAGTNPPNAKEKQGEKYIPSE